MSAAEIRALRRTRGKPIVVRSKGSGHSRNVRRGGKQVSARPGQDAEAALRERVKELTCLYGIAQLASEPGA